jgi:hypothetical protein
MCKEHYEKALGLFAMTGSNLPDCVEFVGLVYDKGGPQAAIVSSVGIDEMVTRCREMLDIAEQLQRQARMNLLHAGDTPPTAH